MICVVLRNVVAFEYIIKRRCGEECSIVCYHAYMKRIIPALMLIIYSVILIQVLVFKDVPLFRIGHLKINFGGTATGEANYIPFRTIFSYLFGDKGFLIGCVNLLGNILLLVPLGFLVPVVYRNTRWRQVFILAVCAGALVEILQAALRVGIFDIDDVLLNALGVVAGYWAYITSIRWMRLKNYTAILIAITLFVGLFLGLFYFFFPALGKKKQSPVFLVEM